MQAVLRGELQEMAKPDEQIMSELIERLKHTRLNIPGMTQEEASQVSGLSVETIKSIEIGRSKPNLLSIIALARAYNLLDQIEALFPYTISPLAELEKMEKAKRRRRASSAKNRKHDSVNKPFVWGEDR